MIADSALQERYDFAQGLAREAGHLAYDYYKRRDELAIESKGLQDVVSIADKKVEDLIRSALETRFPEDAFLGEESGSSGVAEAGQAVWVVDPIDGTACFLSGIPTWCVSIAMVLDGEIEIGVIYDPNVDELYAARRGQGAFLNGRRQPVPPATSVKDGLFGTGFSQRSRPQDLVPFIEALLLEGGMFMRNGSGALMLAYVAVGRLVGYYEPHINSWDSLAGLLLVREAGGWTCDFRRRRRAHPRQRLRRRSAGGGRDRAGADGPHGAVTPSPLKFDRLLEAGESGIEAAVEADEERHAALLHDLEAGAGALQVDEVLEAGSIRRGDVAGVDLPDAAGSELR